MNKCEWKYGKINYCEPWHIQDFCTEMIDNNGEPAYDYCPFCGADIRKPKESENVCNYNLSSMLKKATQACVDAAIEAENMCKSKEPEWKTLDITDLSECPDILVNSYDFLRSNGEIVESKKDSIDKTDLWNKVLFDICQGLTTLYRKTPTKKTNEELAEEYAVKMSFSDMAHGIARESFIAGRESMETL